MRGSGEYQPGSDLFIVYSDGRNTSIADSCQGNEADRESDSLFSECEKGS
jgi:hypothetical protein